MSVEVNNVDLVVLIMVKFFFFVVILTNYELGYSIGYV